MTDERLRSRESDLVHGGPVLGSGEAPGGSWELRGRYGVAAGLHFYVELRNRGGIRIGGSGCGGIGLADSQRPVVISMSGHGPLNMSFCYVGQVIQRCESVALTLGDATVIPATLLDGGLPVRLWIAFTHTPAVPVEVQAFDAAGELIEEISVPEHRPRPGSSACWGPIDD